MWIWISRVLRSLIGLAAIVLAVALFSFLSSNRADPAQTQAERTLKVVRAVRVQPQPVALRWSGFGTARALDASNVAAEVSGRVIEQPQGLEAGIAVQAGDLLAKLDPRDYLGRVKAARRLADSFDAQLASLEIEEGRLSEQAEFLAMEVEVAERDLARARAAAERNAANASDVDSRVQAVNSLLRNRAAVLSQLEVIPSRTAQLIASMDAARADQSLAEDNLSRTEIRAPFDGVLQSIAIEVGEWARAGDTVARVVDLSVIEVPLQIPQSAAGRISIGDAVDLFAEGVTPLRWAGSIGRIAPESDASMRSMTVFVEVRQRPDATARTLLRPGQFVMGEIVSNDSLDSVVIPRRSVDAGRVLVASKPLESAPDAPKSAQVPMVVREAEVDITHYIEEQFLTISPAETQWAVLRNNDEADPRGIRLGEVVLTSNLEMLRVGELIDVRLESESNDDSSTGIAATTLPESAEGKDTP